MKNILFVFLLTSCTYSAIELMPQNLKPLEDFAKVTMVEANNVIFEIDKVQDVRANKNNVGEAKTGLSNQTTPIYVQGGVENYVKERFHYGLKKRGVALRDQAQAKLNIAIAELKVGEEIDGKGPAERSYCHVVLNFDFYLERTSNLPKWSGTVNVKAHSKGTIFDATAINGAMLESCMNEAVEQFIREEKFQKLSGLRVLK